MAERIENWMGIAASNGTMEVSDRGRVRSRRSRNGKPLPDGEWRLCDLSYHSKGYLTVSVGGRLRLVHDIVLESFVGPCPPGCVARHDPDPTRTNNNLGNLSWGTPSQNNRDTARAFRIRGQRLTEDEVWGVKLLLSQGLDRTVIEAVYPTATPKRISAIRTGVNWGHVGTGAGPGAVDGAPGTP